MSKYIPFRLRSPKDDDIREWLEHELARAAAQQLEMDRSDVIRAALRFYFRCRNIDHSPAGPSAPRNGSNPTQGKERQNEGLQRASARILGKPLLNTTKKKKGMGSAPRRN